MNFLYYEYSKHLAAKVKSDYDCIIGAGKSGIMANCLGIENLKMLTTNDTLPSVFNKKGKYLIVDDLLDSGKTLKAIDTYVIVIFTWAGSN